MLRKILPKCAIFSTFLSKIVLPILNYLMHIFWLLFSLYSIGLLVILETHVTCIRLKYIKRTPCIRPKFVPRFCVNLLCLLFTLLAAIGWQTVNLQMNQTVKYQGAFSRITGFSGKRFIPPPSPIPLLVHPSIFHFFCFPSNSVTQLEKLSDEGWSIFLDHCRIVQYYNQKLIFILVFTKSVNSTFREFWLAPVTRNILGYWLFTVFWPKPRWRLASRHFGTRNLSDKWSSRTNKYQESD